MVTDNKRVYCSVIHNLLNSALRSLFMDLKSLYPNYTGNIVIQTETQ